MKYDHPELQEKLAAEYVLGTLAGPARRRFVKLMEKDAALQAAVAIWEARLGPLAHGVKPVEPPPYVWQRITARTGISQPARSPRRESRPSFWASINFWRPFALTSSALAFGLFLYLGTVGKPEPLVLPPSVVAVLSGKEAKPVMLVTAEPQSRTLTVTVLHQESVTADRDFELWALPQGESPKSLGVVAASGVTRIQLPPGDFSTIPAMAISLEPKGGSPTGSPTGPVLYQGAVVRVGV